jgi:hypothetical protein
VAGFLSISKRSKMTLENEQEHCAASTSNRLAKTRIWRQNLSAQYKGDPRNLRAAEMLAQLSDDATRLSDEAWAELKQFYNWDCERWREAVSLTARRVGFQHGRTHFPYFVKHLVGVLSHSSVAA